MKETTTLNRRVDRVVSVLDRMKAILAALPSERSIHVDLDECICQKCRAAGVIEDLEWLVSGITTESFPIPTTVDEALWAAAIWLSTIGAGVSLSSEAIASAGKHAQAIRRIGAERRRHEETLEHFCELAVRAEVAEVLLTRVGSQATVSRAEIISAAGHLREILEAIKR